MNTPTSWTTEQEATIARLMKELNTTRIRAIQYMRRNRLG
jgi:hypothetical protein